ncbi:DUF6543 domain-containing protein [Pseudomonas koreensis]|uniref:DUF6543 domain-containing protein n=1 Tax=Pseudomonas koreensis TaxID=198620 RepID=UPI00207776CB|nr:DUF6543 domain-containing protein [Pseudomonas koreensis]MCM8741652.1 hypothetical protein [Pseudomonas koreensis]
MTEDSSPAADLGLTNEQDDQDDLVTQLVTGPSIREVATQALLPALKTLYPQLDIDPRLALVVTPTWRVNEQHISPGQSHYESLTDALVRHGVASTPVFYFDGEHYLTLDPSAPVPVQMPVSIEVIGHLINELAPLLFFAFQEQQIAYWNQLVQPSTPRWKRLSNSLRDCWNVDAGPEWTQDEVSMTRHLFSHPEKNARTANDPYQSRACLIDLDFGHTKGGAPRFNTLDMAVLIGTAGSRSLILAHTVTGGFERYDTLQTLGESLVRYTDREKPDNALQWRLIEPEGNYFDHLACSLIALQADAIGALAKDSDAAKRDPAPHISRANNELDPTDKHASSQFNRVEQSLPDWMINASPADLTAYSRHLMDLATVRTQTNDQSFQDGIKPIREFALDSLRAAMLKEHADAATVNLADIEIEVDSVVVWGTFVPLTEPERTTLSLVDLALQNLIAVPLGNKIVRSKSAATLPSWMTLAYLEALITSVDIGKTYPALIKDKLLDDPVESLRRQNLFTRHLQVELPLLALQQKIRGQDGIDELGYRYVAAVVQALEANRWVDGQEIVIRPLAFNPGWRLIGSADEVANMFVIGPRHMDKGPCLLYRPLLDQPLSQYPTPANLIYAIKHSATLRQSVLAWLPDGVRANYANYVFTGSLPSVWSLAQLLADPLTPLQMGGTLTLGSRVIATDYLVFLFKANVDALVELAHRQSVSNAQNRWATFKQDAWMIFNAALPFLGRTVGTVAWIWQVLDDVQQTLDAGERGERQQQASAMTDLLLILAMVLAHRASTRQSNARGSEKIDSNASQTVLAEKPPAPISIVHLPDIAGESAPAQHRTSVLTDAALGLAQTLERFAVTRPPLLVPPDSSSGLHRHLHRLGARYYAPIGERWFEVAVDETGAVSMIDTRQQPARRGPALIGNAAGQWFVDTRLRLRGGGLSARRKAVKEQNRQRIVELKQQLSDFDDERAKAKTELLAAHRKMRDANDQTLPGLRQAFLEQLDRRTLQYEAPMEQLKALSLLQTVPNYRKAMTTMLDTQLHFNQTWLDQKNPAFVQTLRDTLALLEAEEINGAAGDRATYQQMVDLTEGVISKIEFARSKFQALERLGRDAAEVIVQYRQRLPTFSLNDLKSLQVSLAREVCLKEGDTAALNEARADFCRLLDTTNLVIQTSQELMLEENPASLSERNEALDGLLEQFVAIDQAMQDFALEHQDAVLDEPFQHMRKRIGEFQTLTEDHLAQLLREHVPAEPRPGPSRPARAPRKRVVKTRFKGTVVGEVRPAQPGEPVLLEVRAPMTGRVIATFHEKTPGVWVERVPARRRRPAAPMPLTAQLTEGQSLLDGLEGFIRQTEASSKKAGRIPVEIEDLFRQKSEHFDQSARALERALNLPGTTASQRPVATKLKTELHQARDRLNAEGQRIRIEMIKQQPPTAARIEWLLSKNEIDIVPTAGRRRLKGPRKDYLKEYEIRDHGTQKALWYAHFHYAEPDGPVENFTAAHLKTSGQRLLAGAFEISADTTNTQVIAIYRSKISAQLARKLFFS